MNASASLRAAQIPTGVARMLMIALLAAAFLLGGTGGYLVRDLGVSWPAGTTNGTLPATDTIHRPFVTEQAPPYASPASSPAHGPDSDLTRAQPAQQDSKRGSE